MEKHNYVVVEPKGCGESIFHSATPAGAAAKAYTHCIRNKKSKGKSHRICLRKRGSEKEYRYSVKEVRAPRDVMRGKELVHYEFKTKVKSLNKK